MSGASSMTTRDGTLPKRAAALPDLKPHQLYPEGRALRADFLRATPRPLMSRGTPVTSIGSCFAMEIRNFLLSKGYNYLQTATVRNAPHSPSAWNRVYNTFSLHQEFQRALSSFTPQERFWELDGQILDPYRRWVTWASREQAEAELDQHRRSATAALTQARVVIITIGLREIWYSKLDGSVFCQAPPARLFDPDRHAFRNTTVEENVRNLEAIHALLADRNPGCQIILTVSPVPLAATFNDQNVVISNALSKATLVLAAHEFISRHDNISYFPGYELVTVAIRKALERDNRHVRRRTVRQIMNVFEHMFVEP